MIACSRDLELKLTHNSGMLDGMILVAGIVERCNDKECSRLMTQRIWDVARVLATKRALLLTHIIDEQASLQEAVDSD